MWVQGQVTGATVEVFANGASVLTIAATSADQVFNLPAGVTLPAGAQVTARQTLGADVSPPSPISVQVQTRPPVIGPVAYRSHLYVCAECLWIGGTVPGATVEVRVNGALRGTGVSPTGELFVGLGAPLRAGDRVEAQQTACGQPGALTPSPPLDATGYEETRRLPPPRVVPPLRECTTTVDVADVLDGSQVTLLRGGVASQSGCPIGPTIRFWVPPLVLNEQVSAFYAFPACTLRSANAPAVSVASAQPVPLPTVGVPLCARAHSVSLSGLIPGARVRILSDGNEVGVAEASAESAVFLVPSLPAGAVITAQQQLCGIWSAASNAVTVTAVPAVVSQPTIPGPLYECAGVVRVTNLTPGSWVSLRSATLGAPIGEQYAQDTSVDISVVPLLLAGDKITASQTGCATDTSAPVLVRPITDVAAPTVDAPLDDCSPSVAVSRVVPGARVEVYVNNRYRGSASGGDVSVRVAISGTLVPGDRVRARQCICTLTTSLGPETVVTAFLGRWTQVGGADASQILAVHAALLRTGKILYFGGDQHTQQLNISGDVDHTRLFDCATHDITTVAGLAPAGRPSNDIFCSGHAFLSDGRLLVGGGTRKWSGPGGHAAHFIGTRECWLFDPASEQWVQTGQMVQERSNSAAHSGGRWYPTLLTLLNGKVLAVSGHPDEDDSRHNNNTLELYDPSAGTWQAVGSADCSRIEALIARTYEYPRLHVLPGADVFSATPLKDGATARWHPYADPQDWTDVTAAPGVPDPINGGLNGSSVLLPLRAADKYTPRALITGASTAFVVDFGQSPPLAWTPTAARDLRDDPAPGSHNPERRNSQSVLLPTGDVFVCGGVIDTVNDATGVKHAESYDPVADRWTTLPPAAVVRNYHSVALLMPDGAVWVSGSDINSATGLAARHLEIEIFEPWYFCRIRPEIVDAPAQVNAGARFTTRARPAAQIRKVAVLRAGSVTHNFNGAQRYIELEFSYGGGDALNVSAPPSDVLVPGYYLLFVLDANNVPSKGRFIRLLSGCLIASAAFSDADAAPVRNLRRFRDEVLARSAAGRRLTRLYERVSPALATWVEQHAWSKPPLRRAIALAAWVLAHSSARHLRRRRRTRVTRPRLGALPGIGRRR